MTSAPETLAHASGDMLRHPYRTVLAAWSWKTAAISAILRALIFLFSNLHSGAVHALQAMGVEAVFAIFASGLLGAVTQRLRSARPLWATALVVWVVMPVLMLAAQFAVHSAGHTEHIRAGLIASFIFAAVASGFTWYAMRQGTLLAGQGAASVTEDARAMPRVLIGFVLEGPRALLMTARRER